MDLLSAAANVKAWSSPLHGDVAAESLAYGLNAALTEISDVSMLRLRATGRRRFIGGMRRSLISGSVVYEFGENY